MRIRPSTATLLLAILLSVVGCDDNGNLIGPDNQLEVTNAVDQFQFQLTALQSVTDSRSYEWQNTGTRAKIDISEAITAGSAILTIRDASGAVMYQADIGDDSDSTTPEGVPGSWQIEVVLTNTTGTFNFRVQKET
jgi:hypothetical protein